MTNLPKKLKRDAIVEAVLEIRFSAVGLSSEVIVGRITDHHAWRNREQKALPASAMPPFLRDAEPAFRFQPIVELQDPGSNCSVKVGPHVLSYHNTAPYIGWTQFQPMLEQAIDVLVETVPTTRLQRLGLRYVNALTPRDHGVGGLVDLDLAVQIRGGRLTASLDLKFSRDYDGDACVVRVASPDLAEGKLPQDTMAIIDVDVFTRQRPKSDRAADTKAWLARAHDIEKTAFFELLTEKTISELRED